MQLTDQAIDVLSARYFDKDEDGNLLEDWEGLSRRVARHIAAQEANYGFDPKEFEEKFFEAIYHMDFLPNSPCLMNAGSRSNLGLLSACFVQIPDDSIDSIMQHAWYSAKLFQAGAGVGYNFSNLRERGAFVRGSMRESSGSISFMNHIFNSIGEVVKQGGRRRAAMMGLLNDNHPEIEDFITFKNSDDSLTNFNISILSSDKFMRAIENDELWTLKSVNNSSQDKVVKARELFNMMIENNIKNAEPGMIWKDNINAHNPLLSTKGEINCVNPCGEATLYNLENCCLGSINLVNHIRKLPGNVYGFDWFRLERTIRTAVRFLDDVVDANRHVHPSFAKASLDTRRIGVGVTGFADCLVLMNSVYGSSSSFSIAEEVAEFINKIATDESSRLAEIKAPYPLWKDSWHDQNELKLRNVSLLAIAPEGSRSIISNTSPSIEPNFGRVITRTNKGIGAGTFSHPLSRYPAFVTTYEVSLESHVKMQTTWQNAMNQNMVSQAISKTNNAHSDISTDELAEAYLEAWRLGAKGLTVYRDGSRDSVYYEKREEEQRDENGRLIAECATGACDIGMNKSPLMTR